MESITFRTRTSTYELIRLKDGYRLVKKEMFPHCHSSISVGTSFDSSLAFITSSGGLGLDDMYTSPIENREEVERWLKEAVYEH